MESGILISPKNPPVLIAQLTWRGEVSPAGSAMHQAVV